MFKVHKCAVCSFTTEDIVKFHEHIPQHKSDGSSYQCRECGLCYTSHNSLSRHLFIVHKLKEPQPTSRQNGAGEDSQQENKLSPEGTESDGVSERKCKVCAKTFETEAALNTHMRTHGMAFIKSKRLSATEKWIQETEDPFYYPNTFCSVLHLVLLHSSQLSAVRTMVHFRQL